jgi:hypothetical protein
LSVAEIDPGESHEEDFRVCRCWCFTQYGYCCGAIMLVGLVFRLLREPYAKALLTFQHEDFACGNRWCALFLDACLAGRVVDESASVRSERTISVLFHRRQGAAAGIGQGVDQPRLGDLCPAALG